MHSFGRTALNFCRRTEQASSSRCSLAQSCSVLAWDVAIEEEVTDMTGQTSRNGPAGDGAIGVRATRTTIVTCCFGAYSKITSKLATRRARRHAPRTLQV